jgi:hypothetical protein
MWQEELAAYRVFFSKKLEDVQQKYSTLTGSSSLHAGRLLFHRIHGSQALTSPVSQTHRWHANAGSSPVWQSSHQTSDIQLLQPM